MKVSKSVVDEFLENNKKSFKVGHLDEIRKNLYNLNSSYIDDFKNLELKDTSSSGIITIASMLLGVIISGLLKIFLPFKFLNMYTIFSILAFFILKKITDKDKMENYNKIMTFITSKIDKEIFAEELDALGLVLNDLYSEDLSSIIYDLNRLYVESSIEAVKLFILKILSIIHLSEKNNSDIQDIIEIYSHNHTSKDSFLEDILGKYTYFWNLGEEGNTAIWMIMTNGQPTPIIDYYEFKEKIQLYHKTDYEIETLLYVINFLYGEDDFTEEDEKEILNNFVENISNRLKDLKNM